MLPFAVLSLSRGLEARLGRAHSPSGGWSGDVGHTAPSHGRFVMRLARVLPPRRRHFWKVIPACMLAFVGWGCANRPTASITVMVHRRAPPVMAPAPTSGGTVCDPPVQSIGSTMPSDAGNASSNVASSRSSACRGQRTESAAMEGIRLGCQPGDDHRRRRSQRLDGQVMPRSTAGGMPTFS